MEFASKINPCLIKIGLCGTIIIGGFVGCKTYELRKKYEFEDKLDKLSRRSIFESYDGKIISHIIAEKKIRLLTLFCGPDRKKDFHTFRNYELNNLYNKDFIDTLNIYDLKFLYNFLSYINKMEEYFDSGKMIEDKLFYSDAHNYKIYIIRLMVNLESYYGSYYYLKDSSGNIFCKRIKYPGVLNKGIKFHKIESKPLEESSIDFEFYGKFEFYENLSKYNYPDSLYETIPTLLPKKFEMKIEDRLVVINYIESRIKKFEEIESIEQEISKLSKTSDESGKWSIENVRKLVKLSTKGEILHSELTIESER